MEQEKEYGGLICACTSLCSFFYSVFSVIRFSLGRVTRAGVGIELVWYWR
jgi:hypothetical protein